MDNLGDVDRSKSMMMCHMEADKVFSGTTSAIWFPNISSDFRVISNYK